jgi:DNA-binding MarR family transcriptional regulator
MSTTLGPRSTTDITRRDDAALPGAATEAPARHEVAGDAVADGAWTEAAAGSPMSAWADFTSALERLSADINRTMHRDHGLSLPEALILIALAQQDGREVRVTDLAHQLQWERSRLSHQLARMEHRGLVVRGLDPHDGRATLLGLTGRGRRVADAAGRTYRVLVDRLFVAGVCGDQLTGFAEIVDHALGACAEPTRP